MKQFNRHRDGMMAAADRLDSIAFHKAWQNAINDKALSDTEFEHLFDMHDELAACFRRY